MTPLNIQSGWWVCCYNTKEEAIAHIDREEVAKVL